MGNREGQRPCAPTGGIHRPARSDFPAPAPPRQRERSEAVRAMANVHGERGPAGFRHEAACAACSLRATERAVSRGISRGFCTGRPRRPMGTVTRGSDQALLLPG
jgi:hypothetical protein